MTREETVREFLAAQSTLVLSTATGDGAVRSAPLFYLLDDRALVLYWLSSMSSEHSVNAVERPNCAAAVFRPTEQWQEIVGVQMIGTASVVPDIERPSILAGYCERFRLDGAHSAVIAQSTLFRFRPSWVRFIDNSQGFGFKFELTLEDGGTLLP